MPFKVEFDLKELSAFEQMFEGKEVDFEKDIRDMLNVIGYQMQADSIEMIIRGPKRTGKKYQRGGKWAQRSAPGEPAKQDTGNLQSSLDVMLTGIQSVKIGYLKSIAPYGEDLENPSRLNRPVLATVQAQNITFIRALIRRTVNRMIKL